MTKLHLSVLALCAIAIATSASAQTIQVNRDNRTIAVTATDRVSVLADTATVQIGRAHV